MIVIGGSLGGMKALRVILKELPATFPLPIACALHRRREPDDLLSHILQQDSAIPVSEALDKEPICGSHVYIAPPDYHLQVDPLNFSLSIDDPVQYARPSIDVLFESAADAFGPAVIAIVLTGANHDGQRGAARIQSRGGLIIVQDPETSESPVMPQATLDATGTRHVYSPEKIGAFLLKLVVPDTSKNR